MRSPGFSVRRFSVPASDGSKAEPPEDETPNVATPSSKNLSASLCASSRFCRRRRRAGSSAHTASIKAWRWAGLVSLRAASKRVSSSEVGPFMLDSNVFIPPDSCAVTPKNPTRPDRKFFSSGLSGTAQKRRMTRRHRDNTSLQTQKGMKEELSSERIKYRGRQKGYARGIPRPIPRSRLRKRG